MKKEIPESKERSLFWPLNKIARAIGDLLLSPFKPPENRK